MKVTHELPKVDKCKVCIEDMPVGSVGINDCGEYYFRSFGSAVCLNRPGDSYVQAREQRTMMVTLLRPGTIVTLEIE